MQDAKFVSKAFSRIAGRYVLANHVMSLGVDWWWRRVVSQRAALHKPQRILDLATGSGDLAAVLLKACPGAEVLGADFSLPMLRHAQARRLPALIAADALRLPLADASFDLVTVAFGLRNMASWPEALREMRRVLKPDGHLMVLDFSLPSVSWLRRAYCWYLREVMPKIGGLITGQREAYEYLCTSIEAFPSGQDMVDLMRQCGLGPVEVRPLTAGVASLYEASVMARPE